ncbi:MAG: ISAs1 family transposase [Acidobacteriota bacterium]|nr:ISAs1 family transposase [Acidobacteriota bacterium]
MATFGQAKHDWFKEFLELPHGIPSPDTFARVFQLIKPTVFQAVFMQWVNAAVDRCGGDLVNIDGKQLRGTSKKKKYQSDGQEGLRMVSAWAARNGVVLGQVKTDEQSNEITAMPTLLDLLELKGCIVTIDAMGCQTKIVEHIVEREADYMLSLKGNQGTLHTDVREYFEWAASTTFKDLAYDFGQTLEKDHGRIEERRCYVTEDIEWLEQKAEWAGLKSIIMVEAKREVIGTEPTVERRYLISSLAANAHQAMSAVRGHWKVENHVNAARQVCC